MQLRAADIASGTSGDCSWVIGADGVLTISPTSGTSGTLGPISSINPVPWKEHKDTITRVIVNDSVSLNSSAAVGVFDGLSNCTTMNLSGLSTVDVTSMGSMFSDCSSLETLDLSSFDTSKVTDMRSMFKNCTSLTTVALSSFTGESLKMMDNMFYNCTALTELDLSGFSPQNLTTMAYAFRNCTALTTLKLGNFNTENVTSMEMLFSGCSSLTQVDVSSFNTTNVTKMTNMFSGCKSLTNLDVTTFKTAKVASMNQMFTGCSSLTSLDVRQFNTVSVTDMTGMFSGCAALRSLDVSNFETSKVTKMSRMFFGCKGLTSLDITPLEISATADTSSMVSGNSLGLGLKTDVFYKNMGGGYGTPIYLFDKDGPSNVAVTNLDGSEGGIVYRPQPIAVAPTKNGSVSISGGAMTTGTAEAYFAKTAPLYASETTVPTYDPDTKYAKAGSTVTLSISHNGNCALDTLSVTKADGSAVELAGADKSRTFTMPVGGVTVTATFKVISVRIMLYGNGGAGTGMTQFVPGTAVPLPDDWTKPGYTFGGWYESSNFSGTPVTQIPADMEVNKTYYAKWILIPATAPTITAGAGVTMSFGDTGRSVSVAATSASGHNTTYQWYRSDTNTNTGGTKLTGATGTSYAIPAGTNVGSYYFYCAVTAKRSDNLDTVTVNSAVVTLTVNKRVIGLSWSRLTAEELVYSGAAKTLTVTATNLVAAAPCIVTTAVAGDNKNVGSFSYTATKLSNDNYQLPETVTSPTYAITQRPLTPAATAVDKTYDGTTAAVGTITLEGAVAGEKPTAEATFAFETKTAGVGKTVSVTDIALTGDWG